MSEEINVANRALTAMGSASQCSLAHHGLASEARSGYEVFTELSHFCNICFS
jgi:hypothetical protein